MAAPPHDLRALIRKQLVLFIREHPAIRLPLTENQAARDLTRIVRRNFESGRYERFRQHRNAKPIDTAEYVATVIACWMDEESRWDLLGNDDAAAWETLRTQLVRAARKMMRRVQTNTGDQAEDLADRACIQILQFEYPFDVPFNAWVYTILQRVLLERRPRKDSLAHAAISLDESVSQAQASDPAMESQFADPKARVAFESVEERDALARALVACSPLRRTVIFMSFFEEKTDAEIAAELDISRDNVQTVRHRALVQLSKLLGDQAVSATRRRRRQDKVRGKQQKSVRIEKISRSKSKSKRKIAG